MNLTLKNENFINSSILQIVLIVDIMLMCNFIEVSSLHSYFLSSFTLIISHSYLYMNYVHFIYKCMHFIFVGIYMCASVCVCV